LRDRWSTTAEVEAEIVRLRKNRNFFVPQATLDPQEMSSGLASSFGDLAFDEDWPALVGVGFADGIGQLSYGGRGQS